MLYAAAAVLSRDPNGRRLALLTACVGIAFHVGSVLLWCAWPRRRWTAAGPLLSEIAANAAQTAGRSSSQLGTAVVARPPISPRWVSAGPCWC